MRWMDPDLCGMAEILSNAILGRDGELFAASTYSDDSRPCGIVTTSSEMMLPFASSYSDVVGVCTDFSS